MLFCASLTYNFLQGAFQECLAHQLYPVVSSKCGAHVKVVFCSTLWQILGRHTGVLSTFCSTLAQHYWFRRIYGRSVEQVLSKCRASVEQASSKCWASGWASVEHIPTFPLLLFNALECWAYLCSTLECSAICAQHSGVLSIYWPVVRVSSILHHRPLLNTTGGSSTCTWH